MIPLSKKEKTNHYFRDRGSTHPGERKKNKGFTFLIPTVSVPQSSVRFGSMLDRVTAAKAPWTDFVLSLTTIISAEGEEEEDVLSPPYPKPRPSNSRGRNVGSCPLPQSRATGSPHHHDHQLSSRSLDPVILKSRPDNVNLGRSVSSPIQTSVHPVSTFSPGSRNGRMVSSSSSTAPPPAIHVELLPFRRLVMQSKL